MPTYEYGCVRCGHRMSLRRLFSEMDAPAACLMCGADTERQFSPNGRIFVPIHFKQWRNAGAGAPGGGQYGFSDFHGDATERELAHDEFVAPASRARSQPGHGG